MYFLLPFRFTSIANKEILVNEVGDFLVVDIGTAKRIVERQIAKDSEIFKDLISNFFISETAIPSLIDNIATRYRTKKSFLTNFTSLHIFVLTLRCNQNCNYCQASSRKIEDLAFDMTISTLEKSIDLMFLTPSPYITMEFQGGESSLTPNLIDFAIQRSEEINIKYKKTITYVLCTNLINISSKIIELCKKYDVLISTSLDGPPYIHDINRGKGNSYKKVVEGIKIMREELGRDKVSALMTTSELSLKYPKEIIYSYIENGFNSIFLRPLNPFGLASYNVDWERYNDEFFEFYKRSLELIIDLNKNGILFIEEFTAILLRKILTPFSVGFVDLQSPSGIINNVIVYNYDGYVYASDESRMLAEIGDYTFQLGHYSDHYNQIFYGEKTLNIAKSWSNEALAGCSDCAFQAYCGADPVRNYSIQKDMEGHRPTSMFCRKMKNIFEHIFSLIIERPDELLPIFKQWIR